MTADRKSVPREPTQEMELAWRKLFPWTTSNFVIREAWQAMFDAAPAPTEQASSSGAGWAIGPDGERHEAVQVLPAFGAMSTRQWNEIAKKSVDGAAGSDAGPYWGNSNLPQEVNRRVAQLAEAEGLNPPISLSSNLSTATPSASAPAADLCARLRANFCPGNDSDLVGDCLRRGDCGCTDGEAVQRIEALGAMARELRDKE